MISCLYLPEQKTELNKAISDAFPKYTLYYHVPPNKLVMAFYIYIFYNTFLSWESLFNFILFGDLG